MTAIGFLLFFSYGLIFQGVNGIKYTSLDDRKEASIFAFIYHNFRRANIPTFQTQDKHKDFNFGMNLIGIILVTMPIITIITHPMSSNPKSSNTRTVSPIPVENDSSSPDIYYIILDAYARADYLKEYIQVDTSELLQGLKDRGFFIGDCSLE